MQIKTKNEISLHTGQNGHDQKNLQTINAGESVERREPSYFVRASLVAQLVETPPAVQETLVRFLGQEDPLEKR